jgi:hypothetical protein
MTNLVSELDALFKFLEIERSLRDATQQEIIQGIQNGACKTAHDQMINSVLVAAEALIAKARA